MIKTPLSTVIGGAFWTPGATVINGAKLSFETVMKKLFANGEQGFFYDPNDLTTLYQDAAGTIPVTAAGQPVGLMLDKSKGVELGSNIIVNGDASQGLYGWATTAATLQDIGDSFLLTASTQYGAAHNSFAVDTNNTYIVEVEILNNTAGNAVFILAKPTGESLNYAIKQAPTLGKHSLIFRPKNSGSARIAIQDSSTTPKGSVEFRVLSVREIKGNHAYQTVSASRPILQRNATTGAYYLAFDGADDFLQTNSIDFTATDKLNLFAGVRKSGDTVVGILAETSANANNNVGAFYVLAPSTAGVANSSVLVRAATTFMSTAYTNPALAVGIPYLLGFKSDIATKTLELSVNANLVSAWNKSDVGYSKMGNYPLYIGRRSTGVFPFNGHLYSLIGIGRLTTDSETIALEKSIAKNTGVALSV